MIGSTVANVTNGVSMISPEVTGWAFTIVLLIFICFFLFLAFKGFRKLIIGLPVTGCLAVVLLISRSISTSYQSGNDTPLKWLLGIMIFGMISFIIGHFLSESKTFQKWLDDLNHWFTND